MLPDFIIIGAMKGGTTSLYRYIASHPEIVGSSIKETNFFATDENFRKGVTYYKKQFRGKRQYAFEASPNYTKRQLFPGVPERMHSVLPDIKLVYVLRDPIERAISNYVHNCSRGRELQPFSQAIRNTNNRYIANSRYFFQIQAFLPWYNKDSMYLLDSHKLKHDTAQALDEVFAFLGISADYDRQLLNKHFHQSETMTYPSAMTRKLLQWSNNRKTQKRIRAVANYFQKPVEKPLLSAEDKAYLVDALQEDVESLRAFSGVAFEHWSL